MFAYIVRRLALVVPTLFGIILINFVVVQLAPGGPIEQLIGQLTGEGSQITQRITRGGSGETLGQAPGGSLASATSRTGKYRGAQGLDPEFIAELERRFGFDKPLYVRFFMTIRDYALFDFGESFFRDRKVIDLVIDKLPVSISLGLWTTILVYLICIPLGIAKAVRDGSRFDTVTSGIVIVGYAIPSFLFAVLLVVVFAGGSYLEWFPLRGLVSENWHQLSWPDRILDYFWHMALPITAMVIGGFATLTMLTKNSFLDQISQQYVVTARSKGLTENRVLYGHVFRNAMLIVIAGFPGAFIGVLFTGSVFIETIFSLDGLGRLGFEAAFARDYPVMFGTLYVFSLMGLILNLVSDLTYHVVDPRIHFEAQEA